MPSARFGIVFFLFVLVIGIGSIGYQLIEGYPPSEAFFLTVMTITTVGSPQTILLSDEGKLFTAFLILGGIGVAFYAVISSAEWVIQHMEVMDRTKARKDLIDEEILIDGKGSVDMFDSTHNKGKLALFRIAANSPLIGKTKLEILKKEGIIVMAHGLENRFDPDVPFTKDIDAQDSLLVLGTEKKLKKFEKLSKKPKA